MTDPTDRLPPAADAPTPSPDDEMPDDEEYDGDGWCLECGDKFHLDDVGGYNPPCKCGMHCRHCHEVEENGDYYERDEEDYPDD